MNRLDEASYIAEIKEVVEKMIVQAGKSITLMEMGKDSKELTMDEFGEFLRIIRREFL